MIYEEVGAAVAAAGEAIAKAGEIVEKAFRETGQAITLWALARNKCYKKIMNAGETKSP